jgi:hypothetical protein
MTKGIRYQQEQALHANKALLSTYSKTVIDTCCLVLHEEHVLVVRQRTLTTIVECQDQLSDSDSQLRPWLAISGFRLLLPVAGGMGEVGLSQ